MCHKLLSSAKNDNPHFNHDNGLTWNNIDKLHHSTGRDGQDLQDKGKTLGGSWRQHWPPLRPRVPAARFSIHSYLPSSFPT
ncbi:hypothetical protein FKM82_011685 [Ascaphus truei]